MAAEYSYKNFFNISEAMRIYNRLMPGPKFTLTDFNILCLVRSFNSSGSQFYMSNDQLADILLATEKTIRTSINRLCDAGLIKKELISSKGRYLTYQSDNVNTFIKEMKLIAQELR